MCKKVKLLVWLAQFTQTADKWFCAFIIFFSLLEMTFSYCVFMFVYWRDLLFYILSHYSIILVVCTSQQFTV